jgi:Ca2+-binding RTX toxin-like protein
LVVSLAIIGVGAGSAGAATITVAPQTTELSSNAYPFGYGINWTPYAAFIYRNVPAFELKTNDTIAFDLKGQNNADIQFDIDLARTTFNGSDISAGQFTRVVLNNQTAAPSPRGDSTEGNYDLGYKAITPFSFPGGGLIIRFSNPSPTWVASDNTMGTFEGNLGGGNATDPSGFFLERSTHDADGVAPWTNSSGGNISAFRITTASAPPAAAQCQGKPVTVSGSDASETIKGTEGADVINAGGGNDKVVAKGGNDVVCAGDGNDTVSGGAGRDRINGEAGKDLLKGGKGKDTEKGGPGKDTLIGGPKNDVCIGGSGKDTSRTC